MAVVWVAVLIMAAYSAAAPAVKYDQRQEGDVNVRADLENFVILIIPASSTGSLGILDLLTKAIPTKAGHFQKKNDKKQPSEEQLAQQHFIESKTAPYHVDISRTRSHLAKLHPRFPQINADEVLIAHSPVVALSKTEDAPSVKTSRTITVENVEDPGIQALIFSADALVNKESASKADKDSGDNLTLLGSDLVQCAPDQKRDAQGICQLIKA